LATFFGQAIFELRLDNTREPEHPCLVLIDEARELDVAEVRRIAGIGRGRGIGMALSYQDYPQVLDQYGDKGAKAILETMMTKIFLPGVNGETAIYASDLLGKTTIHTETSVDYKGTDKDNTRYSETGRALMLPDEIRQMPKFCQLLVVTDTAPPVKAAFPPVYLRKDIQKAVIYRKPEVLRFSDTQIFGGGNFAPVAAVANGQTIIAVNPKKPKISREKKQSATSSVGSSNALQNDSQSAAPPTTQLDAAAHEATDRALDEIGERMAHYEMTDESGGGNYLALVGEERPSKQSVDFMEQKLNAFLLDESSEQPLEIESDSSGEEVIDRFDSDVVLKADSPQASSGDVETSREVILSASFTLTDQEAESERKIARQNLELDNEFYYSLAQRVL
jgi:hypothetical protein